MDCYFSQGCASPLKQEDKATEYASPSRKRCQGARPVKQGHWSAYERERYHLFLEAYHTHFEQRHLRRLAKIFKLMAGFIGTRAPDQCRSHHQKMEKKHGSFHGILRSLRRAGGMDFGELQRALGQARLNLDYEVLREEQLG